ncbi:hypothetical protein JCM8547_004527 [Rhodosporidiobolus lusitaniae]
MGLNPHAAARLRAKKRGLPSSSTASSSARPSSSSRLGKPAPKFREKRAADLQWKKLTLPAELGFNDDGGLLELDEIEGVDVQYEDGKVVFKTREDDDDQPPAKKSKKGKAKAHDQDGDHFVSAFPDEEDERMGEPKFDEDEELSFPEEEKQENEAVVEQAEPAEEEKPASKPTKAKEKAKGKKRARDEAESKEKEVEEAVPEEAFNVATCLPAWQHLPLPTPLYRALHELSFTTPTAIQERTLLAIALSSSTDDEPAVESAFATSAPGAARDVVGVAQTGSGKTYAYGLPILSHILSQSSSSSSPAEEEQEDKEFDLPPHPPTRLSALILCPTRELALQVRQSLSSLAVRTLPLLPSSPERDALAAEDPRKRVKGRLVNIVALTGGMSVEKQKRQLEKGADIVVATPGRLWDLIGESDLLVREIKGMKFLVIDEADRMIENGHYAELDNIVKLTRRQGAQSEEAFTNDFSAPRSSVNLLPARDEMQTFVFSATMSKELQQNFKRKGGGRNSRWRPATEAGGEMSSLDDLLERLDFRDPDPEIIDLAPENGLVETLKECKVECLQNEKDIHLYHFLLRYPARTIVFLSAIDGIRRLFPLLTLLKVNVIAIHSGMQQRQRLKALDKFKSSPNAVLIATDVAARGLDIPSVSHVVHFQLPRSADTYVHRSGRTARAGTSGLALQLVAPEERNTQRMLMASLGKTIDLPTLPLDFSILDQLKQRVELARKIDQSAHKVTKQAHEDKWLREAAEAMEIDLSEDEDEDDPRVGGGGGKKKRQYMLAKNRTLRAELEGLLKRPLMVRGASAKYLTTRGTVGLVDQLVGGTAHSSILGVEASTALDDLSKQPKTKADKRIAKALEGQKKAKPAKKTKDEKREAKRQEKEEQEQ